MKSTIKRLIENNSFDQVERMMLNGQIGQACYEAYCRVWEWCSPRFGGIAGLKHDQFWKRHGKGEYYKKINKVRSAFGFQPITIR